MCKQQIEKGNPKQTKNFLRGENLLPLFSSIFLHLELHGGKIANFAEKESWLVWRKDFGGKIAATFFFIYWSENFFTSSLGQSLDTVSNILLPAALKNVQQF